MHARQYAGCIHGKIGAAAAPPGSRYPAWPRSFPCTRSTPNAYAGAATAIALPTRWLAATAPAAPCIPPRRWETIGTRSATGDSTRTTKPKPRRQSHLLRTDATFPPQNKKGLRSEIKGLSIFFLCKPSKKLGAPGRIRTYAPLVRSQVLYPAELRALRKRRVYTMKNKARANRPG